jgi:hypothetical protein
MINRNLRIKKINKKIYSIIQMIQIYYHLFNFYKLLNLLKIHFHLIKIKI